MPTTRTTHAWLACISDYPAMQLSHESSTIGNVGLKSHMSSLYGIWGSLNQPQMALSDQKLQHCMPFRGLDLGAYLVHACSWSSYHGVACCRYLSKAGREQPWQWPRYLALQACPCPPWWEHSVIVLTCVVQANQANESSLWPMGRNRACVYMSTGAEGPVWHKKNIFSTL
jgi:hypothetical protein